MQSLEEKLGHCFADKALLETALTHSSYANEHKHMHSNERLEFLGDSVLGFCAARSIYERYPEMPEGEMTRLRAELVCEGSLHRVALHLGLSDYMRLGRNEEGNGGRNRPSILADAVEALIAAMTIDGGIAPARRFIQKQILDEGLREERRFVRSDYKTQLQELLQKGGGEGPRYEIVAESGPDHDKSFTARVSYPGGWAEGSGKSKKEAERQAAQAACEALTK